MNSAKAKRNRLIIDMYQNGMTLEAIGSLFNLTKSAVGHVTKILPESIKDVRAMRLYGCTWQTYQMLLKNGASRAFTSQRGKAKRRGIGWELTLAQWWQIWDKSVGWENKFGHVMGRYGDEGPYAVGNVYICTSSQNIKDGAQFRREKKPSPTWLCFAA